MATQTSMLHVRVDDSLKTEATEKLARVGFTVSDAVRILLTRVAPGGWTAGWAHSRSPSLRPVVSGQGSGSTRRYPSFYSSPTGDE
jgi:hypothetical protein